MTLTKAERQILENQKAMMGFQKMGYVYKLSEAIESTNNLLSQEKSEEQYCEMPEEGTRE